MSDLELKTDCEAMLDNQEYNEAKVNMFNAILCALGEIKVTGPRNISAKVSEQVRVRMAILMVTMARLVTQKVTLTLGGRRIF